MKPHKYSLVYAKDLSVPPGGSTGNNEMVEFPSLWAGLKYVIQTKAARAAIRAGRYYWIRIVPKDVPSMKPSVDDSNEESFS